eukprot:1419868-Amphidinium_carterae.1
MARIPFSDAPDMRGSPASYFAQVGSLTQKITSRALWVHACGAISLLELSMSMLRQVEGSRGDHSVIFLIVLFGHAAT